MFTLAALKQHKLDSSSLRLRFDTDRPGEREQKLIHRWAQRAQSGREWNLQNYKHFLALDRAWEAGFRQVSQTLVSLIKDLREVKNEEEAISAAQRWNMTHLIETVKDPKSGVSSPVRRLSLPALREVILSMGRAYTLQRTSDLCNQLLQSPILPFNPTLQTMENKARADVLTARAEQMAREFGYDEAFRQFITRAAIFGHQLVFPQEEWYEKTDWDEQGEQIGREGLRLVGPHPSRCYYDLDYPMWTFNTGTGSRYAGYWRVRTWGDVKHERHWWNIDRIRVSSRDLDPEWSLYANTTGQCRIAGPYPFFNSGTSQIDRESTLNNQFYNSHPDASPIWITEHFEMINPKRDLDPVMPDTNLWIRVVLGSDDTPLYVGPLCDRAVSVFQWEPMDSGSIQNSLLLELLPYQDHCSNLMTQGLITIFENLRRVIVFDATAVGPDEIRSLKNPNQGLYQIASWLPYTRTELEAGNFKVSDIFHNVGFEKGNVSEHLAVMARLIEMMERIIGISAADVGGTASHELRHEEVLQQQRGTSQRKQMQLRDMDKGIEGVQGVIYAQTTNHGKAEAFAMMDKAYTPEFLEKIGFRVESTEKDGRSYVRSPVGNLRVESFSSRHVSPPSPNMQIGQQMVQLVSTILSSPKLDVPHETFVDMVNQTFAFLALPPDFRIEPRPETEPDVKTWVTNTLKGYEQDFKGLITEEQNKMLTQLAGAQKAQPQLEAPQQPMLLPEPAPAMMP